MRNKFKEFYSDLIVDFNNLEEDTIVVFDTNSLLNIYRYSSETSRKFIQAIKKINKNIWIPYQVGLEFNLNRKKVMEDIKNSPDEYRKKVTSGIEKFKNQITQNVNEYIVKSVDAKKVKKDLIAELEIRIEDFTNDFLINKSEFLLNLNQIDEDNLDSLIDLLDGKVGEPFNKSQIEEIIKEGENRYKLLIPPGYEDELTKKDQTKSFNGVTYPAKFGDLIVWKQILDFAKQDKIKKVVFITDDNKPDWWYFIEKRNIGPRAELKNEIIRIANAELIMINSNSFIQQIEETDNDIVEETETYTKINLSNVDEKQENELFINTSPLIMKLEFLETIINNDNDLEFIGSELREKMEVDLNNILALKIHLIMVSELKYEDYNRFLQKIILLERKYL